LLKIFLRIFTNENFGFVIFEKGQIFTPFFRQSNFKTESLHATYNVDYGSVKSSIS